MEQLKQLSKDKIKKSRKFNSEFRKKLITKFDKLKLNKDKNDSFTIYNIINDDIGTNFSTNRNGIFINMNILSDDCIQKLVDFIEDKTQNSLFQSMTQSESEKPVHKS